MPDARSEFSRDVPRLLVSLGAVQLSESAAICRRASLGSRGDGCDPQSEKPTVPDAPASRPQPARSRGGGNHWNRRRFAKSCIASIEASFGSLPVILTMRTSSQVCRWLRPSHFRSRWPIGARAEILYYCLLLTAYIRCDCGSAQVVTAGLATPAAVRAVCDRMQPFLDRYFLFGRPACCCRPITIICTGAAPNVRGGSYPRFTRQI